MLDIQIRRPAAAQHKGQNAGKQNQQHGRCAGKRGEQRLAGTNDCDSAARSPHFLTGGRQTVIDIRRMLFCLAAQFTLQFAPVHDATSIRNLSFFLQRLPHLFHRTRIVPGDRRKRHAEHLRDFPPLITLRSRKHEHGELLAL